MSHAPTLQRPQGSVEPPIPPIEPPPQRSATAGRVTSRSPWLRIAILAVAVVVLLVALVSTLRYRRAVEARQGEVDAAGETLADGNFGSRIDIAERLAEPLAPAGLMARIGDAVARVAGRPGLAGPASDRAALRARVEAERVALFGERTRQAAAEEALEIAREAASSRLDTTIADVLLKLSAGQVADARSALDNAPEVGAQAADADWIGAVVARAEGRITDALEGARRAAERDTDHPFASTMVGELQAESGDLAGGLDTLRVLLEQVRVGHADTRIAFEGLRIGAGKRAGEAVGNLEALLGDRDTRLSPTQMARIHDAVGLYHAQDGDLDRARAAYVRAMETAPGDPRFMEPLARLDLRRFALADADEVIAEAARLAPDDARWTVLAGRAELARGDADRAQRRLEQIVEPDAEALMVLAHSRLILADSAEGDARAALLKASEANFTGADEKAGGLADARIGVQLARYLRTGNKSAFEALKQARTDRGALVPKDRTWPFRAYARALEQRKRYKGAVRQYRNALEIDERDYLAHYGMCSAAAARLDAKTAVSACRAALAVNGAHAPSAYELARVAEARRDAGGVISALSPRLETGPLPPVETRRLARALIEQDALDGIEPLVEGASATQDDASKRYVRGIRASARGKLAEARELLYAAADQLTGDAWVQTAYAGLLLKQDQAAQAAAYFRRAMTADTEPYAALGLAHAELDRNQPEAARTAAREAERRAGRSLSHPRVRAEALAIQARALVLKGGRRNLRRASRLVRKANGVEPDLAETLIAAGLLAEGQRKPELAASRYRRLTQVQPKSPEGFYRLGRLLVASAETKAQGEIELKRADELDPEGMWGSRARQLLGK